jgi:hypothetical protein
MKRDYARETLRYARDDAERRAASAISAVVRLVCGGQPYNSERVLAERAKVIRAQQDRTIADLALRELDIVDGVTT